MARRKKPDDKQQVHLPFDQTPAERARARAEEVSAAAAPADGSPVEPPLARNYRKWFLEYASYVILDRAVPHIDDGLKPVQRRILHTLWELDDGRFHKVANVVGATMRYHPHGDASIGAALVGLAQRGLLIEPQGNFGNTLTGDGAAAPRYIEARLTPFAREVLFNPKTTGWQRGQTILIDIDDGGQNKGAKIRGHYVILEICTEGGFPSRLWRASFGSRRGANLHSHSVRRAGVRLRFMMDIEGRTTETLEQGAHAATGGRGWNLPCVESWLPSVSDI